MTVPRNEFSKRSMVIFVLAMIAITGLTIGDTYLFLKT
jgi:hypothetical protein